VKVVGMFVGGSLEGREAGIGDMRSRRALRVRDACIIACDGLRGSERRISGRQGLSAEERRGDMEGLLRQDGICMLYLPFCSNPEVQ
jgi:hypothetical protein